MCVWQPFPLRPAQLYNDDTRPSFSEWIEQNEGQGSCLKYGLPVSSILTDSIAKLNLFPGIKASLASIGDCSAYQ